MAAVALHTIHVPTPLWRTAHRVEKVVEAVLFTLLPPLVFGLLILSGLILATAVAKIL